LYAVLKITFDVKIVFLKFGFSHLVKEFKLANFERMEGLKRKNYLINEIKLKNK